MKTNMKKLAAWMLALLLVFQMSTVFADSYYSNTVEGDAQLIATLKIISESGNSLFVGQTLDLTIPYEYEEMETTWQSSDESIATVSDEGEVEGISAGTVRITVTAGDKSTSKTIVVHEATAQGEKDMTIVINGSNIRTQYDGKSHEVEYTITSDNDGFNPENVVWKKDKTSRITAGATKGALTNEDFEYSDKNYNVSFDVHDGSVWITPLTATVKANDVTVTADEASELQLTATVEGLINNDELEIDLSWPGEFETVEPGEYPIAFTGELKQGGYSITYEPGVVKVEASALSITSDLYNLACVTNNNTWYRMGKTKIKTEKTIDEYVKDLAKDGYGVTLQESEYSAPEYDFGNEILEYNGKKYVYFASIGKEGLPKVDGYYTAKLRDVETLTAVRKRIGAGDNNPRWIINSESRYTDPNTTNSFHRNYSITFTDFKENLETQDLFNFLIIKVNNKDKYYRLQKTKVTARPVAEALQDAKSEIDTKAHVVKCDPEEYDFSNVVLNIDGKKYVYRDNSYVEPEQFVSYYTVASKYVIDVSKAHKLNKDDTWYADPAGWLDGPAWNVPNATDGYHRNYRATLHEGNMPDRSISITSDWPSDKIGYVGLRITLTAELTGFDGLEKDKDYKIQWTYSKDKQNWTPVDGANDLKYTFILDEITTKYTWRAEVIDLE